MIHQSARDYLKKLDFFLVEKLDIYLDDIEITDYITHKDNGKLMTHQNGEHYAIAYFNIILKEDLESVKELIQDKPIDEVKRILRDYRPFEYVHGNTKKYENWKVGDKGKAYLRWNDEKQRVTVEFANLSSSNRNYSPVR